MGKEQAPVESKDQQLSLRIEILQKEIHEVRVERETTHRQLVEAENYIQQL